VQAHGGTAIKLIYTLLLRDEEDIVATNITYHLNQGADFVIATDNGSVDGTRDILEDFARQGVLRVLDEPEDTYEQGTWVTRMARLACTELGADWVINSDADEFWWPRSGDLKSVLAEVSSDYGVVLAPRSNFLPVPDETGPFYERMTVRDSRPLTELGSPLWPKAAHRAVPDVQVAQGNHFLFAPPFLHDPDRGRIVIFHFPARTYSQYENKIAKGGGAYERNTRLGKTLGLEWRILYDEYRQGRLRFSYDRYCLSPEKMEQGTAAGTLVEDFRLRDFLAGSSQTRLVASESPVPIAREPVPAVAEPTAIPKVRLATGKRFLLEPPPADPIRGDWPIVIGGSPRSGTSLLRRMLDVHPRVHCGPEVHFFRDLYGFWNVVDPLQNLHFFSTARTLLSEDDLLDVLGHAFVAMHERAAAQAGKPRWADKNPHNALFLEQWQRLLGDRWLMLHVVRNPLDTIASIKEAGFSETIPEDLGGRIKHYRMHVEGALAFGAAHPERCSVIVYEELVRSPEHVLRRLMRWLGETFDRRQLDFNAFPHQPGLEDPKIKLTRGIHHESVDRWHTLLTPEESETVWSSTKDLWEQLDPNGHHVRLAV
jgi:sulfotransferase family protein/glycosyl transferase family 2